jgi:hypothetical protein
MAVVVSQQARVRLPEFGKVGQVNEINAAAAAVFHYRDGKVARKRLFGE